jgi:hypothetical protein
MAAISLFWYTNMAAVTSDENDLYRVSQKKVPSIEIYPILLLSTGFYATGN